MPSIVTAQQMRECEQRSAQLGVPPDVLMDHAGSSVANVAAGLLEKRPGGVLVLAGPGNNGGDGLVAARYLRESGLPVVCYVWHRPTDSDRVGEAALAAGVSLVRAETDPERSRLRGLLRSAALIVDALLGTGLSRPLSDELRALLTVVAAERPGRALLAVDVPTGLNSDTGQVDEATLAADVTVTLGHVKAGLLSPPGARYAGRLVVGDIGLPPGCECPGLAEYLEAATVSALLPARSRLSHKGTFGKALVVAGSTRYVGAAALACQAAYRAGAGLVTLACGRSLQPVLAGKLTETTFLPLPEESPGALGAGALPELLTALPDYDALLVGPGLGGDPATVGFVHRLVGEIASRAQMGLALPLVLDADALNALAKLPGWWTGLGAGAVVTPHPGEMARLLGTGMAEVEKYRLEMARRAAATWGVVVVLKGAYTVISPPSGRPAVSPFATPALATAGSGDVLAGTLLGLAAQGLSTRGSGLLSGAATVWTFEAAKAAVYVHGRAGEMLEAEVGLSGGVAGDLLPLLPRAQRELREASCARS
ncbi:MAG: NAD(P)H-hydrate dehydratase [Chloroflexi bacterium]|nr:NAD(P)H-hydrate dehydratase [Chloroflexota bacterium]MCL5110816.1 NAD(P)H-hydrate dehydratase [Chloroflexota bacterium]